MSWPTRPDAVSWAQAWTGRGYAVVPVWPVRDDGPTAVCGCPAGPRCASPGKHPAVAWRNLGVADEATIGRWWRRGPDAGVALCTGGPAGLVVLDVDPAHGGTASVAALEERFGRPPATFRVATGGGGWHWYFTAPGAGLTNLCGGPLGAGIDLRADGGIVIAPPSRHVSGRRYTIAVDLPIAPLPGWLADLAARPAPVSASLPAALRAIPAGWADSAYGLAALDAEAAAVAATGPGGRNHRLVRAAFRAGQLVAGAELDAGRAEATLVAAAMAAGLSAAEARATTRSGLAAGTGHPRSRRPRPPTDHSPKPGGADMPLTNDARQLPDQLRVQPWPDPWREANGFAPHSAYVELVWSGRLGPTTTLLYRRLGGLARACPDGATVDVADLGAGLGLGGDGRWSPLVRSVGRLVLFGAARWNGETLEVRRALPPVPPSVLPKLGPTAQRVHAAELARVTKPTPGPAQPSRAPASRALA